MTRTPDELLEEFLDHKDVLNALKLWVEIKQDRHGLKGASSTILLEANTHMLLESLNNIYESLETEPMTYDEEGIE